jgi:hypothetical protein
LRITTVAERGRRRGKSGQFEKRRGWAGSLRSLGVSPGCCTLTNIVRPSGVKVRR